MKINRSTKISEIIKNNKEAIDVIAAINPHFKKLKNPVLRKVLAPRVSIEDAARIGKCKVEDFFSALASIGFEIEYIDKESPAITSDENTEIQQAISFGKVKRLDVRPVLERGADPFKIIMDEIQSLPNGFVLEVVNSFEPTPLIKILNKKGYTSFISRNNEVISTFFLKAGELKQETKTSQSLIYYVPMVKLEQEKERFAALCKEMDVRDLEMPLPMITILNELEELQLGQALFIHHKKVPQYLLPELEERKVKTWISEIDDGNVKLLIHH